MARSRRMLISGLLLAAALGAGCKKHEPAAGSSAANTPGAEQPASADAAPRSPRGPGPMPVTATAPAVIEPRADTAATLADLTAELRRYVVRTRSVPKNYEEFIAKSQVQAPAPPAGKKYAIQNHAIVLVNR